MIYVKCTSCSENWNVSIKANLSNYICPKCRAKQKQECLKRRGRVSKVLLKNKFIRSEVSDK